MSTTNFWAVVATILAVATAWYDLKSDNRVRDMVIASHGTEIEGITLKVTAADGKLTDTRELLLKISGQLDGMQREQQRQAHVLERAAGKTGG